MSAPQFTPGPWTEVPSDASIDDNVGFTDDATGQRITTWCGIGNTDVNDSVVAFAVFCGEHNDPEFEANIALLKAAPEMHDLLARLNALSRTIMIDVGSAHSARGAAASEFMREDDADFRADLRKLIDDNKALLSKALGPSAKGGR